MRYAREQNNGSQIVLFDTVDIPVGQDPAAFLALLRPGTTGYVHVADDNVVGAVKQNDGTYLNPAVPQDAGVAIANAQNAHKVTTRTKAARLFASNQTGAGLALLASIGE